MQIKKFNKLAIWILGLVVLTIPTFWAMLRPGYFPMQDDLQAFRVFEMDKCFQDLQIPCRWVPDMGYSYGYPQFNFYSPSVFYLGEIFHLTGLQFIDSVKLLFVLGFLLSALSMFLFLQAIFGKVPAILGAILYTYVPFKAVQVYVRGSLSEFWALVLFPLLFWSSYQLVKTRQKKYGIYLALFTALMLLTHNLLSILIFPILAIWCLVLMVLERKWKVLPWLLGCGILGLGLASFFVLPALAEKQYVHTETLLSGYFDYRQHFVPIEKLFLSNEWGYGSSNLGQTETLNLSTGIVQWIVGAAGLILAIIFYRKEKKISTLILVVSLLELMILFMIHQKSAFFWQQLPFLTWLQFPWRFLALSIFLLSFLSAGGCYFLQQKLGIKITAVVVLVILLTTLFLYGSFFQPKDWNYISDQTKFSGPSWQKQLTISIFDYLPIYAKLPPNHEAPTLPEILDGQASFLQYKKGSDYQLGDVNVTSEVTIRLPLFSFPGMVVLANDKKIDNWNNDCRNQQYCLGLITFRLPPGSYHLQAKLNDTPVRVLGNMVTVFSLLVTVGLVLAIKKRLQ